MNALNEKKLETAFENICRNHMYVDYPDLWPGVEAVIKRRQNSFSGFYRKLGFAGAFAGFAVIMFSLAAPVFTQSAIEHLKQFLGGAFSLTMGGKEFSGILMSENGEEKEFRIDGNIVKVKMTSVSDKQIRIGLKIYRKDETGEQKLAGKPVMLVKKGKLATIMVTGGDGSMLYKFAITPEQQAGVYRGNISSVK